MTSLQDTQQMPSAFSPGVKYPAELCLLAWQPVVRRYWMGITGVLLGD